MRWLGMFAIIIVVSPGCINKSTVQTDAYTQVKLDLYKRSYPDIEHGVSNGHLKLADFTGIKLQNANFTNTRFGSKDVSPRFIVVHFTGCLFNGSILDKADMRALPSCDQRRPFVHTKLIKCEFNNASMRFANLTGCDIINCKFDGADLTGAYVESEMLTVNGLAWPNAFIRNSSFVGAKLVNLKNIYIHDSDLTMADLRGSDMRVYGCRLYRANVSGADLNKLVFYRNTREAIIMLRGVVYDNHTVWPKGVTPNMCNAILNVDK